MHNSQKLIIQDLLEKFIAKFSSQSKAVDQLIGVSESTVIQIRKGRFDVVTDDMFRKVGKQVGFSAKGIWNVVPTSALKDLTRLLDNAKEYSNVYAVTAPSGSGKTQAALMYKENNQNVFHVVCAEYFNRKVFLSQILKSMGDDGIGPVAEMMDTIVSKILKMENPIIILDEVDKLNDQVLYFFITLYNKLQGQCGIVMMATNYLAKRIQRGRDLRRKGYEEIYSRVGRKFIILHETTQEEIFKICEANGVTEQQNLHSIYNESEKDLRRVERAIHKLKMMTEK